MRRTVLLVGLPGSGKSTLLPIVKKVLVQQGLPCLSQNELIQRYFFKSPIGRLASPLVSRDSVKMRLAVNWYRTLKKSSENEAAVSTYRQLYSCAMAMLRDAGEEEPETSPQAGWLLSTLSTIHLSEKMLSDNEYLLLDEGLFHKLVNFFVTGSGVSYDSRTMESYLNLGPPPKHLIKSVISCEASLARIRARGTQLRFSHLPDKDLLGLLKRLDGILEDGIRHMEQNGVSIIRIDNSGAISDVDHTVQLAVTAAFSALCINKPIG